MDAREFYSKVERRDDWVFSHLSRAKTSELTHSYHKYPAKFIPQLARALIEEYTAEGDLIWDPFCGSGTLNIEAFRANRHSIGTDINPVAVLISRVKTIPLEPKELGKYTQELLEAIGTCKIQDEAFYISQGILNGNTNILKNWFPEDGLLELEHILWQIQEKRAKKKHQEFALCAFSAILKRCSYWLNSSIKSQVDPNKVPEKPFVYFKMQLSAMEKANEIFYHENANNQTQVSIFKHNAKHRLPSRVEKANCIITSPPYIVSYDYSDIFRLSIYSLISHPNYRQLRETFIGTPLRKNGLRHSKKCAPCQSTISSISDTGVRRTVTEYYKDVSVYFNKVQYGLKENGILIMVVGDTKLRGVEISNAYFLTEIASGVGWSLEEAYEREIPIKILPALRDSTTGRFTNRDNNNCSESYNKEYILIFKRPT